MLYLWSVLEYYQYSLWRYIKLVNLNLNLSQLDYIQVAITNLNKSAKALVSEALLSARAYAQVVR